MMGRYYSRHGGELYIYVTRNDPMVDLSLFPPELGLFYRAEPGGANGKVAIVRGATGRDVDKAEIILSLNGFRKRDLPVENLERYRETGDEADLEREHQPEGEAEAMDDDEAGVEEMEVIIPRARSPTLDYDGDERGNSRGPPRSPSDEVKGPHEDRREEQGADQGRTPISDEKLIDSLVLWMRSQGIKIEKASEPRETEISTGVRDELVELLNEAMRAKTEPRPTPQDEASVDELLREMAAYVRGVTPEPEEAERPKTALEELLRRRAPPAEEEPRRVAVQRRYSLEEELDRFIVEYTRSRLPLGRAEGGREPETWIEEELDRHIVEYIKGRMPISESRKGDSGKTQADEIDRQPAPPRLSEKIKEKDQFPPELVKLLNERLRKEKKES